MFTVLFCMFAGIIIGFIFRKHKFRFINQSILTLIWVLLFLLGFEVGVNDEVVRRFGSLGFEAAMIALAGTLGSVIGAKLLWGRRCVASGDETVS